MLPCTCSVIDHRWRQNVVRTKKWHTGRSRVCLWCSYHILTSSVIYYWIRRTATWNPFVWYNNENISKYFNITKKPAFCPAFAPPLPRLCPAFAPPLHERKPFDHDVIYDLFKMKQFHWLQCVAKNCDWSRKIAPLSNLSRASLHVEWKLTAKAELNCEIYKSWRKCRKNQVSFCHRSSPGSRKVWTLPWKLPELKKYPRKTCGYGQPRSYLIRVLNEKSVNDGGDFCLLWLVILKSVWYSVGDTF